MRYFANHFTRIVTVASVLIFLCVTPASAIEVKVTAPALERTLRRQLFNEAGPDGKLDRHYLKGNLAKGCYVYVDDPHVAFKDDRVVVTVKTHAKLGLGKACFGISLSTESQVSFVPEAEGESVGFRDARIDHLSDNKELDLLMEPFLSKKLPQQMKINAAELMRTLLVKAPDSTGYTLTLTSLKLHSMLVTGDVLVVDLDAAVKVE
jgi:hypothetical protein